MQDGWKRFKSFWTAEEIPRWIGLSLVGILVFGLGAVGLFSVRETQQRLSAGLQRGHEASLDMLVVALAHIDQADTTVQQRVLRSFAYRHPCQRLRVVGQEGLVTASMDIGAIGKPATAYADTGAWRSRGKEFRTLPSESDGVHRRAFRVPIPSSESARGTGNGGASSTTPVVVGAQPGAGEPRFVEGILVTEVYAEGLTAGGWTTVSTGVITLLVIGAFFLLYRLMRRHFRTMARISDHLLARGDQIEQDLQLLRLTDTDSAVARQWNRLIDLVDELSTAQRRSSASAELTQALEKSKRGELADVVDVIPQGLLYVVDCGTLAYANPAARQLMGLDAEYSQRVPLCELQLGPTGMVIVKKVGESLGPEGSYNSVSDTFEVDSGDTTFRLRVLPFNKRQRRGECVVMITDISQQVRAERSSSEFVSQVTHELRTPLTNIRAYAETLSSGVFDDPKVITECYNVITKETRRLGRLIEDVLSMSQLEVGTIQLRIDDVDLRVLLTDSVRDLRGLADERQIDMQVSLPSKLPVIQGDRDKLAVVVNNLLGNALKYASSGGSVAVGCQVSAEEILITVKDDGMGITPADHDRIFEKFQRGSSPEVSEIEGSGIGLTTAREIARRHGGDIEVMSAESQGATFIVHLPVTETHNSMVGAREG